MPEARRADPQRAILAVIVACQNLIAFQMAEYRQ